MAYLPTLVVVSGPSGSGKTTLAHEIARAVGCPPWIEVDTTDGYRPELRRIAAFVQDTE